MAKKELGHVELHWDCPNCGGVNLGRDQTCKNCGAPQPEDIKFYQPTEQALLEDEELIKRAEAGPDIHCPYCGTRNPGSAVTCKQCGGDLSEGARREVGQVIGAYASEAAPEIACPNCGTLNPADGRQCTNCGASLAAPKPPPKPKPAAAPRRRGGLPAIALGAIGLAAVAACIVLFILLTRTSEATGTVQSASWERTIPIEALVPVEYKDWLDEVPTGADLLGCTEEVRSVQDSPASNSVEVCGTPYTVDSGSGFGEVVQDCQYEVYDQFCEFTVEEWAEVEVATLSGEGYSPAWPEPQLVEGQRLGEEREESFTIVFLSNGETYIYTTSDFSLFQQAAIGSEWTLDINTFGGVVSIEQ
ncbi:MAG: zinc ribbon domain-containing protein [Anaerolineales bacterium]|nr:zinc ribbon domain-containing protein [Anaerolineales bacterium]